MKFYLISDNIDTQMGMRLTGIEGIVTRDADETKKALDEAMKMCRHENDTNILRDVRKILA